MSDTGDNLIFRIPAEFVSEWALLTPGELRFGYVNGWLSDADVVDLTLAGRIVAPRFAQEVIEEISLLLSDEYSRLPDLVETLVERDDRVWAYLALALIFSRQNDFDDPYSLVDRIFVDFGYPDDIGDFVGFMPPPAGGVPGQLGRKQRWQKYLDAARAKYLDGRGTGVAS